MRIKSPPNCRRNLVMTMAQRNPFKSTTSSLNSNCQVTFTGVIVHQSKNRANPLLKKGTTKFSDNFGYSEPFQKLRSKVKVNLETVSSMRLKGGMRNLLRLFCGLTLITNRALLSILMAGRLTKTWTLKRKEEYSFSMCMVKLVRWKEIFATQI